MRARTNEELYTLTEARQIICAERECKKEKAAQKILGIGLAAVGIAAAILTGDGSATIVNRSFCNQNKRFCVKIRREKRNAHDKRRVLRHTLADEHGINVASIER